MIHSARARALRLSLLAGAAAPVLLLAPAAHAAQAPDPAAACAALARVSGFPVANTTITAARFNPAGQAAADEDRPGRAGPALPAHCQVTGVIDKRVGTDGHPYGDMFEVRLPVPAAWNGRFMMQGGGGGEGAVPPAVGVAGSLSPTLAKGWAVASQDGGHETRDLPGPHAFFLEKDATIDHAYRSIERTTRTAKYLIAAYYGNGPRYSYWVGCSTGGRQGMVMSQQFPNYFDGIIAGDPVLNLQAIHLAETWSVQHLAAIAPKPLQRTASGYPLVYPALPREDQELFGKAILQACDGLDGTVDGVVDDMPACGRRFNPKTFVFTDTHQPLPCKGAKTPTCLTRAQIGAIEAIASGPRDARGRPVMAPAATVAPDHINPTIWGYPYDGGYMSSAGIPARKTGTATREAGDFATGISQVPYLWVQPVDHEYDAMSFDWNKDLGRLTKESPMVTNSTSLDIRRYVNRGGKIIWYHGSSDPGPPVTGTIQYYTQLAARHGGFHRVEDFARLYLVPNMGHCRGGPGTDQFDLLTPLVAWVEQGVAPQAVLATGTSFATAPTTRTRPLCPYPQQARYRGDKGGDLADPKNYQCVAPAPVRKG